MLRPGAQDPKVLFVERAERESTARAETGPTAADVPDKIGKTRRPDRVRLQDARAPDGGSAAGPIWPWTT